MEKKNLSGQILGIILVLGANFFSLNVLKTQAVELADGTVAFAKPPKLLNAITTFRSVRSRSAKYYFTISLPEIADEPLKKISINLRQGADEIDYRLEKTIAAVGKARQKKENIEIARTQFDEETQTVTVIFAEPISPGTTFTVGLKPRRNPYVGGTYIFGVTAFPDGTKSQGIYLGVGRLQFDDFHDYYWY